MVLEIDGKKYEVGVKKVGDLSEGELLLSPDGKPAPIKKLFDIIEKPSLMYRIELSDGSETLATGDHLFPVITERLIRNKKAFEPLLLTTKIFDSLPETLYEDNDMFVSLLDIQAVNSADLSNEDKFLLIVSAKMVGPKRYYEGEEENTVVWLYSFNDILRTLKELKDVLDETETLPLMWEINTAKEIEDMVLNGEEVSFLSFDGLDDFNGVDDEDTKKPNVSLDE